MKNLLTVLLLPLVVQFSFGTVPAESHEPRNRLPKKQHKDSDAEFLKPSEAVAKMAVPDGFEVSVFASEPDIAEPIAFCFDARDRLWVAENFNYQTRRQHTSEPVSRIQIFEDTDGDGVFDVKKTFTDELTFTSGIACGFGGVFVGGHLTSVSSRTPMGTMFPTARHRFCWMDGASAIDTKLSTASSGDPTDGCTAATEFSRIRTSVTQAMTIRNVNLLTLEFGGTIRHEKPSRSSRVAFRILGGLTLTITGRALQLAA